MPITISPILDFRPYKVGTDIKAALSLDAFDMPRYLYRNGDRLEEFAADDLPTDTAWHFVERVESAVPSSSTIRNFFIYDGEDDITEAILSDPGYTFLILSPSLAVAESSAIDKIDELYDYTREYHYNLYCLTASTLEEIVEWQDNTGADYPFYSMDASTLRTIMRGNPGIVLLHDGVIVKKVRPAHLPGEAEWNAPIDQLPFGQLSPYTHLRPLLTLLVIFFVPMLLLLLTSKTVEAYVVQARVRRVARLRRMREKLLEKNHQKQRKETHINIVCIMRKNIVAGNWKMNKTLQEGLTLAKGIEAALAGKKVNCDVIIGTPFIHLASITQTIEYQ